MGSNIFCNCDYKQLEVRVAAWLSEDENLIIACKGDIHRTICYEVFGRLIQQAEALPNITALPQFLRANSILNELYNKQLHTPYTDLTKAVADIIDTLRTKTKAIVFGVMYGREAPSLATGPLKCSTKDAQKFIDLFFMRYPKLAAYLEEQKTLITERQWIATIFGRRRRFPYLTEEATSRTLKQTINFPIQSTANDICFKSLIVLGPELRALNYGSGIQSNATKFPVHDALAFSLRKKYLRESLPLIKYRMENTVTPTGLDLLFNIDQEIGESYGELSKVTPELVERYVLEAGE